MTRTTNARSPIGLGQLRSDTCRFVEQVARGETIEIVRRGSVVGRIVPIPGGSKLHAIQPKVGVGMCNLDEIRTCAGRLFDRVQGGESIQVVWRGTPVASIVPAVDSVRA
ncbi:hypothetical protein [Mycobacterium sp. UNC410CL29Cvi84]|uniref:type II toxin-antitoxin system Phd/YefM family antitoxin n=1 Tax=Mycobacterium sp. UNC410CL29Cvi84 TaxID=1449059 RepID=UPI00114D417F|nr:hypothetical protein [Mycobacterium sp. UNC410CL29Cvi84]